MFNKQLKQTLQRQQQELDEARQLFAMMEQQTLTIALDAQINIRAVNPAFASALGYSVHELVGRPLNDLVPEYVEEALINSTCPLAFRLGCNQDVVSKACRDLSRSHNTECGPAGAPRRASAQACI